MGDGRGRVNPAPRMPRRAHLRRWINGLYIFFCDIFFFDDFFAALAGV